MIESGSVSSSWRSGDVRRGAESEDWTAGEVGRVYRYVLGFFSVVVQCAMLRGV